MRFASDDDYNFAIERSDASLRTSRLAAMYDEDEEEEEQQED